MVGWFLLLGDEYQGLGKEAASGAAYISNFLFWSQSGYFDTDAISKPFLHLWSLAVEEQFYLMWPLLLIAAGKNKKLSLCMISVVLIFSFIANIYLIGRDTAAAFYLPISRFWELAIGGLVAYNKLYGQKAAASNIKAWSGLCLVIFAYQVIDETTPFPGWPALLPTAGTALLIAAGPQAWFNRIILSSRGMVFVGLISYPLYLWHWPLTVFAHQFFTQVQSVPINIFIIFGSGIFAWLTYKYLESPIRNISIEKNRYKIIVVGLSVMLALVGVSWAIHAGHISSRYGNAQPLSKVPPYFMGDCHFADSSSIAGENSFQGCSGPHFSGGATVMLVGDSHSAVLAPPLQSFLVDKKINFQAYPILFCVPFSLKDRKNICNINTDFVLSRIHKAAPDVLIISGYWLRYQQGMAKYTRYDGSDYLGFMRDNLLRIAQENKTRIIVVGDPPIWEDDLAWVLNRNFLRRGRTLPERTFEGIVPESLELDKLMEQQLLTAGASYISLQKYLCAQDGCLTMLGKNLPDDLIMSDSNHLSRVAAAYAANTVVGPTIVQQLQIKKTKKGN